jgi:superfamily II DNA/RNA helicase
MTEAQMVYHQENAEIVSKIVQKWSRKKFISDIDQRRLTCALQNMRMSCNSTYLLDQETDHGVKADELASVLDGLLADPEAKAVVFSQWVRTHEIVIRRLEARGLGYVSFHGGVPSEKRPALVGRFRDDPSCRVFLSTDAGSTGLNLQHASTIVNMDLPWNPAILEQRIGRIHRMGQKRPVHVINFVSAGTIEEGMLSVLAFKRSLSAGILDGGASDISLGGSRLTRFMKDVENVTGKMGTSEAVAPAEEAQNAAASAESAVSAPEEIVAVMDAALSEQAAPAAAPQREAAPDPWQFLLQAGAQFASALAAANDPAAAAHPWIERDPANGAKSLKIPLPPPETVKLLANALSALAVSMQGRGR